MLRLAQHDNDVLQRLKARLTLRGYVIAKAMT
jgi:hypothetical protein